MRALGDVGISEADTSFQTEPPKPALPGLKATFIESVLHRPVRQRVFDLLVSRTQVNLELSLRNARSQVESVRSSTTLAALAQVLEATDARDEAIAAAHEALTLCGRSANGHLVDPTAARIALEVLIRLDKIDDALVCSRELPIGTYANLLVGSALAGMGRFGDARELLEHVDGTTKDAVLAFLLISEGSFGAAVPLLRAALRRSPDDADSAHNLSIALWQLGSRRKARASALQATRSAPGREDISLHFLELLLAEGEFARSNQEVEFLLERGVAPTARLLIVQARARLGMNDFPNAERLLSRAGNIAKTEKSFGTVAEVLSNLARLRFVHGKLTRDEALTKLSALHTDFPSSDVVVANLAQVSVYRQHADALRRAFDDVRETTPPARAAFVEYHLATLEGKNELAAESAERWLELEPENPYAISAAIVALGIGMERWDDAAKIAIRVVEGHHPDPTQLNNAAYVLAMAGMPNRAVELLEPHSDDDFFLKATLGLAYLASNQIDRGMKMYRQAADAADSRGDGMRSLMTAYQALVARQLNLLNSSDAKMISAVSLPPVELPEDWKNRPEFLRLHSVALKNGYDWPITI